MESERLYQLGRAAASRNEPQEAERRLRAAFALAPNNALIRGSLGDVLLKQGRLAEGFPLHESWQDLGPIHHAPNLPLRRWSGQSVQGCRILVVHEEGIEQRLDDHLMFARFGRALAARGARVTWIAPPPLVRLFRQGLGVEIVSSEDQLQVGGADFYCPAIGLPSGFNLSLDGIPKSPYLTAKARPNGARIGVVARCGSDPQGDNRSLPLDLERQLLAWPTAVSLGDAGGKDLLNTAEIMMGLDLVITVDSAEAHLAGALGKPVWVLLPYSADWPWLHDRADSPWYPSARLFRQPAPDAWPAVVEEVLQALSRRGVHE